MILNIRWYYIRKLELAHSQSHKNVSSPPAEKHSAGPDHMISLGKSLNDHLENVRKVPKIDYLINHDDFS